MTCNFSEYHQTIFLITILEEQKSIKQYSNDTVTLKEGKIPVLDLLI